METTISYGKSDERRIRWTIKSVRKKQKWKEGDSKMKNDYDKYAKERQERLLNGMMPSHRFVEKPMMKSMMPNLKNKKILMLGCGTGEECNLLEMFGADRKNLVGMDLSKEFIRIAKKTHPDVEFIVGDMNSLSFKENTFDFVYSSLAIHYSSTPDKTYKEVYRVLKKDGLFLFSVGHPIRWSSAHKEIDGKMYRIIGCSKDDNESEVLGNYNTFKEYTHSFFSWDVKEKLSFYVGSPSFHFKLLRRANFEILDFTESSAIEETKAEDINYYQKNKELPQFMAFLAIK